MRELVLVLAGFAIVVLALLGAAFVVMVYGPSIDAWLQRRRRSFDRD